MGGIGSRASARARFCIFVCQIHHVGSARPVTPSCVKSLSRFQADKEALEVKLQTTGDDLTKRLHNAEQVRRFPALFEAELRRLMGPLVDYQTVRRPSVITERMGRQSRRPRKSFESRSAVAMSYQALSEKSAEMERLRFEWTLQSSSLSSRHADELRSERERAAEVSPPPPPTPRPDSPMSE